MFSYNCQSLACKVESIVVLLEECKLLLLQETPLAEPHLSSLNLLDDFSYTQTPAVLKPGIVSGRSSGGRAKYWKKFSIIVVTPLLFNDRLMGIN